VAVDEREDHGVEGSIGLFEERGRLIGLERAPPGDVRNLRQEAGPEEKERLGRLAEGQRSLLRGAPRRGGR
jgi:hypothetical protein